MEQLDFSTKKDPKIFCLNWMQERFNTPFVIAEENLLFELALIKIGEHEHWLFGKYHHLITDGYGFTVWVQYIASKYRSLLAEDETVFDFPSYINEAGKATEFYNSDAYQLEGDYWRERIKDRPKKLFKRRQLNKKIGNYKSSTLILDASEAQANLLSELQISTKVSLQLITIAALVIYFGKTFVGK